VRQTATPRFWLTAFWGFEPENEGYYGFTLEGGRKRFLEEYQDGDFVLIYGADVANTSQSDRRQLLGILETEPTPIWDTDKISDFGLAEKKRLGKENSWKFAVPVRKAWRIDQRIGVKDLLPQTYHGGNGQALASYGQRITDEEAQRIVKLRVTEVSVFGELPVLKLPPSQKIVFETAYNVSRGIQPSFGLRTSSYEDGEAFLYVMVLTGDLAAFLGRKHFELTGKKLIKIGYSNNPERRREELNSGFPVAASMCWNEMVRSQPYCDTASAMAAENELKDQFSKVAVSQGGEFFLCDERSINSTFSSVAKAFRLKAN
jgi:T5orf172 domain